MKVIVKEAGSYSNMFHDGEEWEVANMHRGGDTITIVKRNPKSMICICDFAFKDVFGEDAYKEAVEWCRQSPLTIM